jgi:hypothetical protein
MFRIPRETKRNPNIQLNLEDLQASNFETVVDRRWPRGPRGYVPILLSKAAEQYALRHLPLPLRERLLPLIEVPGAGIDSETGEPKHSVAKNIDLHLIGLLDSLGTDAQFLLDPIALAPLENKKASRSATELLYEQAAARSMSFVPVVRLGQRLIDLDVARKHVARGACIRISRDELKSDLVEPLHRVLKRLCLGHAQIDVILDYGDVADLDDLGRHALHASIVSTLRLFPAIRDWRCVVLAMSAFPPMTRIKGSRRVPRSEWDIWNRLRTESHGVIRMPTFGDYAIEGAVRAPPVNPKHLRNAPPTIRFTDENQWQIIRGQPANKCPIEQQYREMARRHLVRSSTSLGAPHCEGCERAHAAASRRGTGGSRSTWRRLGSLHHLTLVAEQIRALPDV